MDAFDEVPMNGVYINKGFDGNGPSETIISCPDQTKTNSNYIKTDMNGNKNYYNNFNVQPFQSTKSVSFNAVPEYLVDKCKSHASLIWNQLSFEVVKKEWVLKNGIPSRNTILKQILKPQCGEIYGGSLTALMGPSGAGKSTLLNCLTGRYMNGVKGNVYVTCRGPKPKATIAFVPQQDDLFTTFTVKETLIFASKMKNLGKNINHNDEAEKVMKYLSLECNSSVKISRCSGGQVKRVCIAVELISHPDILVLDEPTTGLDSSTAAQCIQLLRRLTEAKDNPPAIVATIHQVSHPAKSHFG